MHSPKASELTARRNFVRWVVVDSLYKRAACAADCGVCTAFVLRAPMMMRASMPHGCRLKPRRGHEASAIVRIALSTVRQQCGPAPWVSGGLRRPQSQKVRPCRLCVCCVLSDVRVCGVWALRCGEGPDLSIVASSSAHFNYCLSICQSWDLLGPRHWSRPSKPLRARSFAY